MGIVLTDPTAKDRIDAGPGYYSEPTESGSGFTAAVAASFINENAIAQWAADLEFQVEGEMLDNYDQYRDIPEDLNQMPVDTWYGITSPDQMQGRIAEVRAEKERQRVAATNGWGSFIGGMGGYLLSPETVPELMLTQGRSGVMGAVRVGTGALLAETAHEAALHSNSYTRTWQQSMTNIGISAFAGAGLGAVMGNSAKNAYLRELSEDMSEIASPTATKDTPDGALSIGAAAVATEGEQIINKPWIKWAWLAPVRPMAHATANTARKYFNDFVAHSFTPLKTEQGIAKQRSLEMRVNREIANITRRTMEAMNKGYKEWAGELDIGFAGRLRPKNWMEYQREVHMAMVKGDYDGSEIVKNVATALRTEYNHIYKIAGEARIRNPQAAEEFLSLEEYVARFADGYAPRRYNKKLLRKPAEARAFKEALKEGFIRERQEQIFREQHEAWEKASPEERMELWPEEPTLESTPRTTDPEEISEIESQVNNSYNRIVDSYDLDVYMPPGAKATGDPFKERKIPLRDEDMLARGWLESDIQAMTVSYTNRVLKPSRMIIEAGDTELTGALKNMQDEYEVMLKNAADDKEYKEIKKEWDSIREAFPAWRDRWYGRSTISSNRAAERINDGLRTLRNLNVARMMGMVTLISVGDVFRANLTTIYAPELGKLGPGFIQAVKTIKASRKAGNTLHKLGVAHEVASYVRTGKVLDDSGLLEGTSDAVKYSQLASRGLMRATGLAHWTDWMKELAASYTQNDIIQKMRGFSRLSAKSKQQLANMGIDENMARRLQDELRSTRRKARQDQSIVALGKDDHGYEGVGYLMDIDKFDDQELARELADIIFEQSERNIVSPGAGEVPNVFGSDEVNKTVFQFQSFLFGAATSVTTNLVRRAKLRDPKAIMLLTNMIVGGMAAVTLRNVAYGGERLEEMEKWSAADWIANGLDYSSAIPVLMMGFNYANIFTGNGLVNALGAESMTRYAHRPLGSLLGPSVGTVEDIMMSGIATGAMAFGDEYTDSDKRRIRRLLPYNNFAYTAQLATRLTE